MLLGPAFADEDAENQTERSRAAQRSEPAGQVNYLGVHTTHRTTCKDFLIPIKGFHG
jgi:hypothetical protein